MKANLIIIIIVAVCSLASTGVTARPTVSRPIYKEIQKAITGSTNTIRSLTLDSFGYPVWIIPKGIESKDRNEIVPCNIDSTVGPASVVLKRSNPFGKHHNRAIQPFRQTIV